MKIDAIMTGPFSVNCCIVSNNGDAVIVDPGGNAADIEAYISDNGLKPLAVVNTHGHFDHIGAISEITKRYGIPFYIHKDDEFLLSQGQKIVKMYGFGTMENPVPDKYIEDGEVLTFGSITIKVLHTPGHTPGGCCLYIEGADSVLTGDTLFHESIGRSDFPYADGKQLTDSIMTKLFALDDNVKVYPGHGGFSTIGHEKQYNPYL